MKKKQFLNLCIYFLMVILLASCTLPSKAPEQEQSEAPELADVAAAVAQTIAAMPTNTEAVVVVLTPLFTATPQPTLEPTITPIPPTATMEPTATFTVTPTPTPHTGPIRGEPGPEFLTIYFDAVVRGDYVSAWNNLTPGFKINAHNASYFDYVEGYEKMDLCDIEISNIQVVLNTGSYAKISAHYIYHVGDDCEGYPYDFMAHFNYDSDLKLWLLDGLTTIEK